MESLKISLHEVEDPLLNIQFFKVEMTRTLIQFCDTSDGIKFAMSMYKDHISKVLICSIIIILHNIDIR